jgi:hypothetical protein
MFEPKVPLIGSAIGFVLSLLVGLFSGAAFLVVLFRALGMGLLFGALVFLARYLLIKFLPELLDGTVSSPDSSEKNGAMVDITVGEPGTDDVVFEASGGSGFNDLVPDFMEKPSGMSSVKSSGFGGDVDSKVSGTPEFRVNNWEDTPRATKNEEIQARSSGSTEHGLDVLPDLQDFVTPGTLDSGEEAEGDSSESVNTGMINSLFTAPENSGVTNESETMAKAIRTILARDN